MSVPGYINQLIQIYSLPNPELNDYFVDHLCLDGLVDRTTMMVTPKGGAYLQMLCAVPLPIQKWVDPRSEEKE